MKKNGKLMRASALLLVLTLITSCFVGGTFAKYTTTGSGTDTARVAKWGVTVEVATDKGFAETYGFDGATPEGLTAAVKAKEPVVAPGTYGTIKGVDISGQPEVAVKVETTANVDLENWTINGTEYYCPIVFQVGDEQFCGLNPAYTSATDFAAAVEDAIDEYITGSYDAGTDLETVSELTSGIQWRWAFDNESLNDTPADTFEFDQAIKTILANQDDGKDTALGNKAANDTSNAPDISITIETTVTQID